MSGASSTLAGRIVIEAAAAVTRDAVGPRVGSARGSSVGSRCEGLAGTLAQGSRAPSELRGGCADPGGTLSRLVAAVPRPEGCPGTSEYALLAQSAEHSHGKAGVVGSIPTEGSTKWSG